MAVRSARLFGPVQVPAGNITLYTCPAGSTVLIKRLVVVSWGGNASQLLFFLNSVSNGNMLGRKTAPTTGDYDQDTWWVLEPGESLVATYSAGVANDINVSGHGAILAGVA